MKYPLSDIIALSTFALIAHCGLAAAQEKPADTIPAESTAAKDGAPAVELGKVAWNRNFEKAVAESRKTGKPLMVLFNEVPGCHGCQTYGSILLSHPLLAETADTLFVPVFIRNNDPDKDSSDSKLLQRFKEQAWNYPVIRFMDADGKDITPATRTWDTREGAWADLLENMTKALVTADAPVPEYLGILTAEFGARKTATVNFAMGCFWSGEAKLGALPGVVRTRTGFHNIAPSFREMVQVVYDTDKGDFRALVAKAREQHCAQWVILAENDPRIPVATEIFGKEGVKISSLPSEFKDGDMNYQYSLQRDPGHYFNAITSLQATRMHSDPEKASYCLSPWQKLLRERINALFGKLDNNGRKTLFERMRSELNPTRYRNLYQESLADYQTKLTTFLVKNEAGDSGESAGDSEPRAADAQAVIDACKAGEADRALEAARKLIAADPDRAGLAELLVEAAGMLAKAKQYDSAAGLYRLLIDHYPRSEYPEHAHTELAACYYQSRKLRECHEQVKENLKLYPKSQWVEYWEFLDAQIDYRLYEFTKAKVAYEAFLAKYPDSQYAPFARGDLGRIDPQWEIDRHGIIGYAGKLENDIRFQTALAAAPKYIEDGYGILERQLGVDLRNHTNVLILFKDSGVNRTGGVKATTRIIGINNKPNTMIEFFTEYVVTNPEGFRKTVVHEMKHAGFAEMMGGQSYHSLPEWIREGLAVWASEDVDSRVTLVLSNIVVGGRDPMRMLDGIEQAEQDNNDYLEGSLAFEWLESRNAGNVKAFCQRLVKGEPYRKIWADLAGTGYDEAMTQANAYCRKRVADALGPAYEVFVPLRNASETAANQGGDSSRAWLADGGETAMNEWLKNNPGHAAAPYARFCLGRVLTSAGRHDEGRALLQQIIDQDVERSTLADDAQFFIGLSFNAQQDKTKAREAFSVLVRDFPYSMHAKAFIGKLPPAGPVTRCSQGLNKPTKHVEVEQIDKVFRAPAVGLVEAIRIAEGYLKKEGIDVSAHYLDSARLMEDAKAGVRWWKLAWKPNAGGMGGEVWVSVGMDRKALPTVEFGK
jgi:TolA-binding protein